jgi:alkylation response protein AidB-like acyl-CoA dehydrogenase
MQGLTEEQAMLLETGRRLAAEARGQKASDGAAMWRRLCALGWAASLVPETHGGVGGGAVEAFVLGYIHGQGLPHTNYLGSAVLAPTALSEVDDALAADLLPRLASGQLSVALAHQERPSVSEPQDVRARATRRGGGFVLDGEKVCVVGADAGGYLVSARDEAGAVSLFYAPADGVGLSRKDVTLIDGRPAATLTFAGTPADAVGGPQVLRRTLSVGAAALVGEAAGALDEALAQSIAYIQERRQFGKTLSSFQALRHRIADMYMIIEEVRALGLAAATAVAQGAPEAETLVRSAKVHVGLEGVRAAEQAIQLHGAMGVTQDATIGACLQRLVVVDAIFGSAEHHLDVLAAPKAVALAAAG